MTLDEKNIMIESLTSDMEEWSPDDLLAWAKEAMASFLNHMDAEELKELYNSNFKKNINSEKIALTNSTNESNL